MSPAEHNKLIGIQDGAQVNPDLSNYIQQADNNSLLTNDSGFITAADIPVVDYPVDSVNGKTGDVTLDLQEITDQGNTTTNDIYIGNGPQITLKASDGSGTFDSYCLATGVTSNAYIQAKTLTQKMHLTSIPFRSGML